MRAIRTNRTNWYEQQFIKMAYSRICKKKYYLVLDLDTIPIRPIKMFKNNIPFFDMKTEHHKPYFKTLKRLFPDLHFYNQSYISEHMMIKVRLMKKLLNDIEMNKNIPGKVFWEKILMCIDIKDIKYSGFSEFETYGTYVDNKFPNIYKHRKWYSRRDASFFFNNSDNLEEKDIKWLSKEFHALSFENWKTSKYNNKILKIAKNWKIQMLYTPKKFFKCFKKNAKKIKINNKIK